MLFSDKETVLLLKKENKYSGMLCEIKNDSC